MVVVREGRKEGDARDWGKGRKNKLEGRKGGDSQYYLVQNKRSRSTAAPGITPVIYSLPLPWL